MMAVVLVGHQGPIWAALFLAFQRHHVTNYKKRVAPAITEQIFWFSLRMRAVSLGVLEFSLEGKSQGEKGKNDCNPNECATIKKGKLYPLIFKVEKTGENSPTVLL